MRRLPLSVELTLPRVAWHLALASLVVLYAYPALVFAFLEDMQHSSRDFTFMPYRQDGWDRVSPEVVRYEGWTWHEWPMWLLPLAAVVLPSLLHGWLTSKCAGSSYRLVSSPLPGPGYRGARGVLVEVCPRLARRRVAHYLMRLALAAALCVVPFLRLIGSRLFENYGCIIYMVRSVPEYLVDATILLAVVLWHWPTETRLLGERALPNRPLPSRV
jgi:hypothetical protein